MTVTELMVWAAVTVTVEVPDFEVSSVDVAVMVAVPAAVGEKTPAEVTEPPVADHNTEEL